jgi:peroxiredoxin
MAEMPNIRANYEKYHEKGFEVVAISRDRKLDVLNQYVQSSQVPWTVVADLHARTPEAKQMATYYGVTAIPCAILIGRDGNVVSLNVRGKALEQQLEKLLGSGG